MQQYAASEQSDEVDNRENNPVAMHQNLIVDDDDLVNAAAQGKHDNEGKTRRDRSQHQQQLVVQGEDDQAVRFEANQYGSFAANNDNEHETNNRNDGERVSVDDQDGQSNAFNARNGLAQQSDLRLNERTSQESTPQLQKNNDGSDHHQSDKELGQSDHQSADKNNQEEEEEDVELYDVDLQASESDSGTEDLFGQAVTEGINTDEFEHIAEIYDQIRMLHQQHMFSERSNQQLKTQIDRNLASYFDAKLKKVMEELALC